MISKSIRKGISHAFLTSKKREEYMQNSKLIKFWRENPVIACEDLLFIKLLDFQAWILDMSWNTPQCVWCESRNSGKSFMIAIFCILKAMLYEDLEIFIVSSVGSQAKETFGKIEEIVLRKGKTAKSINFGGEPNLVKYEIVKSVNSDTGFTHAQDSYRVEFRSGTIIRTLNGKVDNNRGKRGIAIFDEAGFCSEDLLEAMSAFATQNTSFKTGVQEDFNIKAQKKEVPMQVIYASSASNTDTTFYSKYREFAISMIVGERDFFCCDIPCDIPLNPKLDSKDFVPLFDESKVTSMMNSNREKGLREYYNIFDTEGGESQPFKSSMIIRNETFTVPKLCNTTNIEKFILAIDPARSYDNSACGAMEIIEDEEKGLIGDVSSIFNFVDWGKRSKKKTAMRGGEQVKAFRNLMLDYNGKAADYENIDMVMLDQGSGGAGIARWSDDLMEDWTDVQGKVHHGILDKTHEEGKSFINDFPRAQDKLRLVNFRSMRTALIENLLKMMELDLIRFPKEYNLKGYVIKEIFHNDGTSELKEVTLSLDEEAALVNIDTMKTEMKCIHKFDGGKGAVSYGLPKDKVKKMHDDRFFVLCMLAWRLSELRREDQLKKSRKPKKQNWLDYIIN